MNTKEIGLQKVQELVNRFNEQLPRLSLELA